jgi:hypothetical protein
VSIITHLGRIMGKIAEGTKKLFQGDRRNKRKS